MLIPIVHQRKLTFITTLAFLAIGLSLHFTIVSQAKPPNHSQLIGPGGGKIDTGYNSYLFVPEGALEEEVEICAEGFDYAFTDEPQAFMSALKKALPLLDAQYSYINQLPKQDNGSDEWARHRTKLNIRDASKNATKCSTMALQSHNEGDGWKALEKLLRAIKSLDKLDARLNTLMNGNEQMGAAACANIQAYSDQVRPLLETADSLYNATLFFEFEPHGTEFLIPAELVVPWDEIIISDELFWYSGDGELIDLIEMDYFIDESEETIHFLIDHFSGYYLDRR